MSEIQPPREYVIPTWVSWVHGTLLLAGLGFYCFLVYALIRPLFGTVHFDITTAVKALMATCVLSVFIIWFFPLADLPLVIYLDRLPRARVRKGKCPVCNYPKPSGDSETACTECGASGTLPPVWSFTRKTITRFGRFLAMAILLGSAVAETLLLLDETRFTAEAETQTLTQPGSAYTRPRIWPASYAMMTYTPENGVEGSTFLKSERIRKWMRNDS